MPSRLPESPPVISGYTPVRPLGSGGFADVFLYEQSMPRRRVAIKVLLPGVADGDGRAMFLSETTLMAQLSDHPDVLTVYEAAIASDGRPYIVMEYCPESYGRQFRDEPLAVSEALQVAIAIGSVLETAHRDGVLHRDVKPANILKTSYGRPVLADFGIAATLVRSEGQQVLGLSVPWSAPEVIRGTTQGTIRTEIWAFGATVYGLLAGRSPFEVPGGDNSRQAVQQRIVGRSRVAPIARAEVPPALEEVLASCLSKDIERRPSSMLEVLRSLQAVEAELGMRPSRLVIPSVSVIDRVHLADGASDRPGADSARAAPATPMRRARSKRLPQGRLRDGSAATHSSRATGLGSDDDAVSGIDRTELRAAAGAGSGPARLVDRRRAIIGSGAILGIVVIAGAVLVGGRAGGSIPRVATISANTTSGSVEFSWTDPGLAAGDTYLVRVDGRQGTTQRGTSFTLAESDLQGQACVTVTVVRDGADGVPSSSTCAGG